LVQGKKKQQVEPVAHSGVETRTGPLDNRTLTGVGVISQERGEICRVTKTGPRSFKGWGKPGQILGGKTSRATRRPGRVDLMIWKKGVGASLVARESKHRVPSVGGGTQKRGEKGVRARRETKLRK